MEIMEFSVQVTQWPILKHIEYRQSNTLSSTSTYAKEFAKSAIVHEFGNYHDRMTCEHEQK